MQPLYLPWIGIFKAIDLCDDFIFHDDVQFEKQSWQQRNRILNVSNTNSDQGSFIYLSVPVEKNSHDACICDIKIKDILFYKRHLILIRYHYRKAPYVKEVAGMLEKVYEKKFEKLFELNIALLKALAAYIGVEAHFHQSEQLGISGGKTERLVNFCKHFRADTYLSAVGSKAYLDMELFKQRGIKVEFLDFEHPIYPQLTEGFVSHLSVVDALCHLGPQATLEMIRQK